MDVGRDDHPAARHFRAHELGSDMFAMRDVVHLLGDDTLAGIVHLRANLVIFPFSYPLCAHDGSCGRERVRLPPPAPDSILTGTSAILANPAYCLFALLGLLGFLLWAFVLCHGNPPLWSDYNRM